MKDITTRIDQLIELVAAQNELLNAQNKMLRTFVEAAMREEEEAVQMQEIQSMLGMGKSKPDISTMDPDEDDNAGADPHHA